MTAEETDAGPTRDQICTYLQRTGWRHESSGPAGALWVLDLPGHHANGRRLGVPDDSSSGYPLNEVIVRIAAAEHRNAADVHNDVLDVDNPIHARIYAWAISSMCERAAAIIRRQLDDGSGPSWTRGPVGEAILQAADLADVLDRTAGAIKVATDANPNAPLHLFWTAAAHAAEAIVKAEPAEPDDMEALKQRLDAMRAEAKEEER